MAARLGPAYPAKDLPSFPGMSFFDAPIWRQYLRQTLMAQQPRAIHYNVRIGPGREPPEDAPHWAREDWWLVTARRIDAVVQWPDAVELVECRHLAKASAVGRLQIYDSLWAEERPLPGTHGLLLLTDWTEPDIIDLTSRLGIRYLDVVTGETNDVAPAHTG